MPRRESNDATNPPTASRIADVRIDPVGSLRRTGVRRRMDKTTFRTVGEGIVKLKGGRLLPELEVGIDWLCI